MLSDHDRTPGFAGRALTRAALCVALSAALLTPRAASAQSAEEKAAARALATQGAEALGNKKFAEAIDLVTRAEAIVHAPTHLLMIARAQVGLGKLVAAHETYLKLTREELAPNAPNAFKNAQADAKEEIVALEPRIAQLRIILDGPGGKKASVKMDEQAVPAALIGVHRPVDPGRHAIAAYVTGRPPIQATVDLREGEKKEVRLTVPDGPLPPGVPGSSADNPDGGPGPRADELPKTPGFMTAVRGAGIGVGAVGVAGIVVGAIFFAKSGSTQSQADDLAAKHPCPNNPEALCASPAVVKQVKDLDSSAASQKTIGAIGLAAGGVALAGGVVMLIVGKPKPAAAPAKAGVEPWFSTNVAGLRGWF